MTTKRTLLSVNGKQRIQIGFCKKAAAGRILARMGALPGDIARITYYHVGYGKNLQSFDVSSTSEMFR